MKTKKIISFLAFSLICMVGVFASVEMAAYTFPSVGDFISQNISVLNCSPGISFAVIAAVSVYKESDNAGRPLPKSDKIVIFDWDDVLSFPGVGADKITVSGNITFKPGVSAIEVYATASTISAPDEIEGDDDARGVRQHINFSHPGNGKPVRVLRNAIMNKNLGILVYHCNTAIKPDLFGTPCNPMKLGGSSVNDNTGTKKMFEFSSSLASEPTLIYEGNPLPVEGDGSGSGIGA